MAGTLTVDNANVDTILNKAGSGGTNVKINNTSTYVGEGGAGTQNAVQGIAKVWIAYDNQVGQGGNTNTEYIWDSFNVGGFTDHASGLSTVTYTNAMNGTKYAVAAMSNTQSDSRKLNVLCFELDQTNAGTAPTTTSIKVENIAGSNGSGGGVGQDPKLASFTIHGDLA
tara:strand:+ start:168 stop:674 length:507 start_codon:yes stop_codon:yes gene_type:complete